MASSSLKDATIYVAGYDLTGDMNAVALEYGAEMLDATTFGQTTRINKGGIRTVVMSAEGFWDADGTDEPDDVIFSRLGTGNVPISIAPLAAAVGARAYLFRAVHAEYTVGGSTGEMLPFSVSAEGSDGQPVARGYVLHAAGSTSATGTGASVTLPALTAGQKLFGAIHVLSASAADTLDVVVQSDADNTYASPTTRLTFAQQSAAGGSDWQTADGAITDTEYRVSYTLGGVSPDFSFVVIIGIAY